METLLKQELKEALQSQFAHEVVNSHIYLYIASFLHGKGLDNLAKHFETQSEDETKHSRIIYSLITDLGEVFEMPEIDGFGMDFPSFRILAETYLAREILTTDSLNEIKLLAQSEDSPNPVVEERMREMILLQQHEYEEATSMLDKAILLPEWWQVALLDGTMG